ncbi:hypothetical protein AB1Y20_019474 [Prymnesium parvum]|uniref:CRAL-TRIO domain-containing protein n=1 Tax=Prymnesium parvum TaxID=97485 RepID=A0AB34JSJ7_PRYPA
MDSLTSRLRGVDTSAVEAGDDQEAPLFVAGSPEEAEQLRALDELLSPEARTRASESLCRMCLRGRKYDLPRAAALVDAMLALIDELGLSDPPRTLEDDLASMKLVVPGGSDFEGRKVCWLRLRNHQPGHGTLQDFGRVVVANMLYAMRGEEAQQRGIVMVNDMTGLSRKNLDPGLFKYVTGSILPRLPVRVGRILIFNPPFIVGRVVLPVVLSVVSKKLRARIVVVNSSNPQQLHKYIAPTSLPPDLGGSMPFDLATWSKHVAHPDSSLWEAPAEAPSLDKKWSSRAFFSEQLMHGREAAHLQAMNSDPALVASAEGAADDEPPTGAGGNGLPSLEKKSSSRVCFSDQPMEAAHANTIRAGAPRQVLSNSSSELNAGIALTPSRLEVLRARYGD